MTEITQCFSLWLRMIFLLSHTVLVIDSKLSLDRLTGCNEAVNLLLTPRYAKQLWTLNWNPWLKSLSEERWQSLNLNRSPDLRKRIILNLCACSVDCGPHRLRLIHADQIDENPFDLLSLSDTHSGTEIQSGGDCWFQKSGHEAVKVSILKGPTNKHPA